MAKKKSDRQNGGINVENSSVRIEGDAVGRDKVERHEYYTEKPYGEWEEFYAGGFLSKLLIGLGGLMLVGGMLGFLGSIIYSFVNFPGAGRFEGMSSQFDRVASMIPFVGAAFGVAVVGMVIFSIGRGMARNRAYRQRQRSR